MGGGRQGAEGGRRKEKRESHRVLLKVLRAGG
jgi:hypothetical protein